MKLFVIYATLMALLISSIAQANQCSLLFNKQRPQHSREEIRTMNESLQTLEKIAGAKIHFYRDIFTNKALVIVYDQNRAKKDSKKTDETEDKVYSYTRDQRDAVAESLQKLSTVSAVAVINPYLHFPTLKEKNIYGLYAIAKSELNSKLQEHSQLETDGKFKNYIKTVEQSFKNTRKAIGIGMVAGLAGVIFFPNEVHIGLPIFVSSFGFAIHTTITSFSNVLATMKHQRLDLTEDILFKSFQDSERVVLIVPEEARSDIQKTYDKSGIYQPIRP